ncbi:efflux RND transporter periplasmic adaptor subunit [Roseovarius nubinhibens]|uniref:efflux RND transporter periplasmic adaptor subunit n=1 Tax=Roseovarius nubinhibens TaxID=314263 RepID=UPI0030ECDB67
MRLFPILAAIVVMVLIYLFVFERDRFGAPDTAAAATPDSNAETGAEPDAEAGAALPGVIVTRSVARQIDSAVVLRGRTEADAEVEVRAETSGLVTSEPRRKGSFVEAGEARARLPEARAKVPEAEARVAESRARVEEAKARLSEAQINDNAAKRLSQGGYASDTRVAATEATVRGAEATLSSAEAGLKSAQSGLESAAAGIEAARAGIESAQAGIAAAQKEIDRLAITAPFAGLLETDTAERGSLLQPGALCATVLQLDPIILVGFVPETEVDRVTLDAPATATLASGKQVAGKVSFLSRSADEVTRTFRVEVTVENDDLAIRDGQTAEILIAADGASAHLLPQSVLTLNDQGDMGVRLVTEEDTAAFRPVQLLRDTPEGVWLAGLPDNADVIVIGQEYVTDGVRVRPSYQADAQ